MSSEAKVALVTGSSSGIGAATVKLLSQKGYKVAIVGTKPEKVERVSKECHEASPSKFEPLSLILDFNDPKNGEVAVQKTVEHFGKLDVLVNNAGIFTRTPASDPKSYETYREVMTINTDATVKATLASVEHIKKASGNIIFVSSVASTRPSEMGFAYCMSKASMSMFAKCLAIDLAPNVRVNIVSPGPVLTSIFERVGLNEQLVETLMNSTTLQNRVGQSEEIASTIAFLISDEASFVNGHEMYVDGGYLLKPSTHSAAQKIINFKKQEK